MWLYFYSLITVNRKVLIKSYEDQNQLLKIALEELAIAIFGYHERWIASESGTIYWVLNIDPLKYLLLLPLKDGPPKPIVSTLKTVLLIKSNGEALGMVKKIRQSDDIEKEHIVFTCVNIFSPIESLHGMKINKVSGNNRFFLVLTEDNKVFAWGENDRGQFGFTDTEDRFDRFVPLSVYKDTTIVDIAAGDSHSILMDSSGHLWGLGYNY
ncbi:hypothetical protein TRFO_20484 [Tritrichomonas foetus]|uniref:Regulator of chromosome condensation n=1 Tax=Tritrichomonas foetus TaxID=1144522 RepID=A0A1J4KKW8_9EUKA|nr:hypothetical protein TRFO_20484 [Tritrichomonas foetus]|eukprot:OHT10342.1 hypothetical protein TRFO_20484 [Tritrichomonas foetus]